MPADEIDPHVPLVRYGLDSVAAVQLATSIAESLGRDLPDDLLLECPDISTLARYMHEPMAARSSTTWDRMLADSVLPADVMPSGPPVALPRAVLLTGATGFLGSYLLQMLLQETRLTVHCLVRAKDNRSACERVRASLDSYGLWNEDWASRIVSLAGDLVQPSLGLSRAAHDKLSGSVDAVYHAAADVSWVVPYESLRAANVLGTLELLRLACSGRTKSFHFISSLAVCYSHTADHELTENDDPFGNLAGLPLGYAQSKCVAEHLVRQVAARGLPATVYRPSLITGDSRSGRSNEADFLALLIKGCIAMGSAPDLDWLLDGCPVDFVARSIVRFGEPASAWQVLHLSNPRARRWREAVLWMNLFGYSIRLLPYRVWLERLKSEAATPDHPLHLLKPFFMKSVTADGQTAPELYEEQRSGRVTSESSNRELSRRGLSCPPLDSSLLDRYFQVFIERGFLPAVHSTGRRQRQTAAPHGLITFLSDSLRSFHGDRSLRVQRITRLPSDGDRSLITELTSWRSDAAIGLFPYRLTLESQDRNIAPALDVFIKAKPADWQVMDAGVKVAETCDPKLGEAFAAFRERTGLANSHLREPALYALGDVRFRRHMPVAYGIRVNEAQPPLLALESLAGMPLLDSADDVSGWTRPCIESAIMGMAEIHAVWYRREAELLTNPWIGTHFTARGMEELSDLWRALADHAGQYFGHWLGEGFQAQQANRIAQIGACWHELEAMPRTLIHNDFNPRNLALRPVDGGLRLCAYDWELATLGVPQHDLAELLCFVLKPATGRDEVQYYMSLHRQLLEQASGDSIDPESWRRGFELSLADLMVNRLPMYTMAHTFRKLPFLERVVQTWRRLQLLKPWKGAGL